MQKTFVAKLLIKNPSIIQLETTQFETVLLNLITQNEKSRYEATNGNIAVFTLIKNVTELVLCMFMNFR